jgi:hypothetical protein
MNSLAKKLLIASAIASIGILSGCGGGGSSGSAANTTTPPPAAAQQFGLLTVGLTDAPACGFDQVNVTVSKVRVHQSSTASDTDSGWTEIAMPSARKINLLSLSNGVLDRLGQTQLAVGRYTQVRLVLSENSVLSPMANSVVVSGTTTERPIDTPSAQTGIKINHTFDVAADSTVDLALDFDACRSVVTRGNNSYLLKPVVSAVQILVSGSIVGYVDPTLANSHPLVTAQQNGVIVKTTVPDSAGKFTLSPISAGNYDVVVTADGRASNVIGGVPVVAKGSTAISTTGSPLILPVSTTANLSGTILPATADGEIKASQSMAGGPTVVIASKVATFNTGAYAMVLSSAPPMSGKYGSGNLPIVLLGDLTAAGKYSIEASAAGYKSQTAAIDVSLLNAVKDFTLVP